MDYSVLMSVYYKENPKYFKESIKSILSQSVPTCDFVIVCDGPLTDELYNVLDEYKENPVINVVKLSENQGLAKALAEGLRHCKCELVARMDSDDIAEPFRCEEQLLAFETEDLDVVGSNVVEFIDRPENIRTERCVPETHDDIREYSKKRNPMNHPSVMFKKASVIACGSYQEFHLYEDYQLWVNMIMSGYKFKNIQKPLVKMRTTNDLYMRRGGFGYFKSGYKFQNYMYKCGHISFVRYLKNISELLIVHALMPNYIRKWFYLKILRK